MNFITAIAGLFSAVAWPAAVAAIAIILIRRHRTAIDRLLGRTESAKLPGGIEFGFAAALAEQKDRVIEAAERVADASAEQRDAELEKLIEERDFLKKFERLRKVGEDRSLPVMERSEALRALADATVEHSNKVSYDLSSAENIMAKALLLSVRQAMKSNLEEIEVEIRAKEKKQLSHPRP